MERRDGNPQKTVVYVLASIGPDLKTFGKFNDEATRRRIDKLPAELLEMVELILLPTEN